MTSPASKDKAVYDQSEPCFGRLNPDLDQVPGEREVDPGLEIAALLRRECVPVGAELA